MATTNTTKNREHKVAAQQTAHQRALETARASAARESEDLEGAAARWVLGVRARLEELAVALQAAQAAAHRSEQILAEIDAEELHALVDCLDRAEGHAARLHRVSAADPLPNLAAFSKSATFALRTVADLEATTPGIG